MSLSNCQHFKPLPIAVMHQGYSYEADSLKSSRATLRVKRLYQLRQKLTHLKQGSTTVATSVPVFQLKAEYELVEAMLQVKRQRY